MDKNRAFDYRIFDSLIEKNIRFAIFRLARQKEIKFVLQTSSDILQTGNLPGLNNKKGFVISPFNITCDTPLSLIYPDVSLTGEAEIFDYIGNEKFDFQGEQTEISSQSSLQTFEQYENAFEKFHNELTNNKLQKIVLSRTYDVERTDRFSAGLSFKNAVEQHAESFVFLCNTPETGTWFGISPELLVAEKDEIYKTVALAGTKKVDSGDWDNKNCQEQQIVVDYMQQRIEKIGGCILKEGPLTARAGKIEHLKTKFSFRLKDGYSIGDLLELLHPSPAVCGFPKQEAFDFLLKNEPYDRRYYSGFVGPLNMDGISRLYVNLRCMQIGKDILRLYAGGGMLPSSELDNEWEETENKLQTILSVI